MATPKSQRIGIWIITIVLAIGTLGSFLVIALGMQNQEIDSKIALEKQQEQQKMITSMKEPFGGYSTRTFDATSVTELQIEVIQTGEGQEVKPTDKINVSYFGYLSNGELFDSSKYKDSEDSPISFGLDQVIKGWTEGLTGQKVGSVVRLTIPAEKAYGSRESASIPANSPLEFIVQIHKVETETDSSSTDSSSTDASSEDQ